MLRRLGNKRKLITALLQVFPEGVRTFVDVFAGSCCVSFAMLQRGTPYIIANDSDGEVFNLFLVLRERKAELVEAITNTPYHEGLWQHWKTTPETDPVWRAVRFLFFSNFGYMGLPETLRFDGVGNHKLMLLTQIDHVACLAAHPAIQWMCCDFREALWKIGWRHQDFGRASNVKNRAFLYLDPPYLGTENNYLNRDVVFQESDTLDVFDVALGSGMKFAISEFDHPFVLEQANKHGLFVHELGERQTLKNRNVEVIITNYDVHEKRQLGLFGD